MAPFCSLLLASLSMAVLGTEAQVSVEGVEWKQRFVLDVAADNPTHNFSSRSIFDCPLACSRTTGCEMFGYQPGGRRCLLYDRTVDISTGGAAAPDTRYWRRLCPVHRQYRLLSGVCFRRDDTYRQRAAAQSQCRVEGADLAIADSAERIAALNHEGHLGWVGAMLDFDTGIWYWRGGQPVLQTVYGGCTADGPCLLLHGDVLRSCNCTKIMPHFCEIPL